MSQAKDDFVWTNPAGGYFAIPGDWSQNLAPQPNGEALVYLSNLKRDYVVSSADDETIAYLQVGRGAELSVVADSFVVAPANGSGSNVYDYGNIAVGPGGKFILGSSIAAQVNGPGGVSLDGDALKKSVFQTDAVSTGLYGGGVIALHGDAEILGSTTAASTLENKGDKIVGWGEIGNDDAVAAATDGLWLINGRLGVIVANGGADDSLVIDTGSNLIVNSGLIETTGAGGLVIDSDMLQNGQLIAAGAGTLTIGDGAVVTGAGAVDIRKNGSLGLADGAISTEGALTIARGGLLTTSHGETTGVGANNVIIGDAIETDVFNDGLIDIVNNSTLNLSATVTQSRWAQISLGATSGQARLELFNGGASLSGGQLVMSDSAENFIVSNGAAEQLSNSATILGAGVIGDGYVRFYNGPNSLVDADQSAGLTIVGDSLALSLGVNLNVGLIEATDAGPINAGMLTIEGALQNSGKILAKSDGEVVLDGADVDAGGGVIETIANGEIVIDNGSVISAQGLLQNSARGIIATSGADAETVETNVLNDGYINVVAGSTLLASRTWNNFGVINLGNATRLTGGANLEIAADDRLDLIGSGFIRLANAADVIVSAGAAALLLNESETIVGAGTLGDANLSIVNAFGGTIDATGAMFLGSQVANAPFVVNSGTIEAGNGALLTIDGMLANSGDLIAQSGGTVVVKQSDLGAGLAILEGTGIIEFSGLVDNEIVFDPRAHATAILEGPTSSDGDIRGFAAGDTIDLANFKFTNATSVDANLSSFGALSGALALSNGSSTSQALYFEGDYQKGAFEVSSDNLNGTLITWAPSK